MISGISLKTKISTAIAAVVFPVFLALGWWAGLEMEKFVALETSKGLMNFVDAKQQGVIRYIGQNRKLAATLLDSSSTMSLESMRLFFQSLVKNEVYSIDDHKYKAEILEGNRRIPAWNVYYRIDYVRDGVILVSSDVSYEGKPSLKDPARIKNGYTDIYQQGKDYWQTFSAGNMSQGILLHANGQMLENIVSGEVGNLEKGMGAYYLAGVGKTFDYYITNADNTLLTASRVQGEESLLTGAGNRAPWLISTEQERKVLCRDGLYVTNVGATTFCRETMGYYRSNSGERMLGASMPFYDSSWTIVVEQQEAELLAPFKEMRRKLFFVLLGVTILTFLLLQRLVSLFVKQSLRVQI